MRIYIAHPYTGDEVRNRERALRAEELLRKATPQTAFYNPVGRMSESKQFASMFYAEVIVICLGELARCDGVVFCGKWEDSPGCRMEAKHAKALEIPRWFGVNAYVTSWKRAADEARRRRRRWSQIR